MTRVAVIMGGWSSERPVSLSSGKGMAEAARKSGFDVVEIDASRRLAQQLEQVKPDVALNALHGPWGEDGCVQGILKPIAEGSSFGVFIVRAGANRPPKELTDGTWKFGRQALVEKFIPGRELTVGVMGDRAMAVTEITTLREYYDFDAKYQAGGSRHVLPADLPNAVTEAALDASLRAHKALGCRGVTRSDFRYDEKAGRLVILETNTQPGMTPTSLIPEQAAYMGIDYPSLVRWMIEDASCPR